jgi:hypothetical protein
MEEGHLFYIWSLALNTCTINELEGDIMPNMQGVELSCNLFVDFNLNQDKIYRFKVLLMV